MSENNVPAVEAPLESEHGLQEKVEESLVRARDQVTQFGEQLSTRVRERPLTALAIAAGIGYLGARLIFSRR